MAIPMAEVVAVTGDIGAGKSTVAHIMEAYGGAHFDADAVTRELWRREDIRDAAVKRWGQEILHSSNETGKIGEINFAAVAARMFASPIEYQWACHLLHPLVMQQLAKSVSMLALDQWAVSEIPLLFEVGRPNWANVVIYVTAPRELRLARVQARGWDEAELKRRESFYMPSEDRMRHSDFIISNDGDLDELKTKVRRVLEAVLHYSSDWLCWLFELGAKKTGASG